MPTLEGRWVNFKPVLHVRLQLYRVQHSCPQRVCSFTTSLVFHTFTDSWRTSYEASCNLQTCHPYIPNQTRFLWRVHVTCVKTCSQVECSETRNSSYSVLNKTVLNHLSCIVKHVSSLFSVVLHYNNFPYALPYQPIVQQCRTCFLSVLYQPIVFVLGSNPCCGAAVGLIDCLRADGGRFPCSPR